MDSKLWGWQILFLIEGAFTVAFAILTAFMLPWSLDEARFLDEREKEVGRLRVLKDGSSKTGTKFNVREFFKPLKDPRFYAFASIGKPLLLSSSCICDIFLTDTFSDLLRLRRLHGRQLSHPNHWPFQLLHRQDQLVHRRPLRRRYHLSPPHLLVIRPVP